MSAPATVLSRSTSFIGRESQLKQLHGLLAAVLGGAGRVCFIGGEAGVGKTALVQEFTRRAQDAHPELIVAAGDCSATSATSDAYLPFREILGLLTGDTDASVGEGAITAENANRLRTLVDRAGEVIAEYGIDLIDVFVPGAALVSRVGGKLAKRFTQRPAAPTSATADDPARVLQQFTNVVRKLAEQRPLVLVVDDMHWADQASIDLLFHLARRIEGSRILVLATYRANEVSPKATGERHPLEPVLNEVARYYGDTRISLETDDEQAGRDFVDRLIDAEPNDLSAAFRAELFRHTLGHPLFTLELMSALRERGTVARNQAGVWQLARPADWRQLPSRTEGVIAERIGRVSAEVRNLLAIAAVEGEQFTAQTIATVAGLDASTVIRQLSTSAEQQHQLVRALGVQKIAGQRVASYRFRHELFRAYLYGGLDEVQRSELHFAVGNALEALHAADRTEAAPVLAHHFEQAGEIDACVRYLDLAADTALRRHAPRQAAEFWQRILSLTVQTDSTAVDRADIIEKRADALRLAGQFDDARNELEQALGLATDPLVRARLLRKQGAAFADQHHLRDALAKLELAEAQVSASSADQAGGERVKLWLEWVWALYWVNDVPAMEKMLARGVADIEQFGTIEDRARWLQMRTLSRLRAERYRPSDVMLELAGEQVEATRTAGHGPTHAHGEFLYGFAHLGRGDLETAERSLQEALRIAEQHAHGLIIVLAKTYLTVVRRLQGAIDDTIGFAADAEAAAQERGMATYVSVAHANRGWALYRRGEVAEAEPLARAAFDAWSATPVTYPFKWLAAWPLAAILLERGDTNEARDVMAVALQPTQQIAPAGVADAFAAGDLAAALGALRAAGEL